MFLQDFSVPAENVRAWHGLDTEALRQVLLQVVVNSEVDRKLFEKLCRRIRIVVEVDTDNYEAFVRKAARGELESSKT